ncbi:hypothetical protein ACQZV8_00975 [Magnetococcales bacterium HHB-1]
MLDYRSSSRPVVPFTLPGWAEHPETSAHKPRIIAGPPGVGKRAEIERLGGHPSVTYIDLTMPLWWRTPALHGALSAVSFGFPFRGVRQGLPVTSPIWLQTFRRLQLDIERIALPKAHEMAACRATFEFILPSAELLYQQRLFRAENHRSALRHFSVEILEHQLETYRAVSDHLRQHGFVVRTRSQLMVEQRRQRSRVRIPFLTPKLSRFSMH